MIKLSAFLTNYNHAQYLSQAIEGILNQSFKDLELIIVDDGSTDNSVDIICSHKENDPRIKVICFPENRGNEEAVKAAIALCDGAYLFAGAADDYLVWSGFFQEAIDSLETDNVGVAYAKANIIRDEMIVGQMGQQGQFVDASLFIPGASSVLLRTCFDELGGFHFEYGSQADFFINHAVALKYGACFMDHVSTHVRQSSKSQSAMDTKRSENHRKIEETLRLMFPGLGNEQQWAMWRKAYGVA